MAYNLISELRWRGMLFDLYPGTEEHLSTKMVSGYIGFDPTAASLHIGNLATIMLLKHLQLAGHKPYALVGGATGMIGDPSGKSEERNLLNKEILAANQDAIKKQLEQFLDFGNAANSAVMVNNYDWFGEFKLLDFLRDVGKHLTVNYMMAKDSVKKRLETGISYTEFTYQLLQGYDFYYLYKNFGITLQMGGSDQWGNITSGTELIRRIDGGEAFALTTPLLTKSDGTKFGKSESGNVWLDAGMTSPYQMYQFFINQADEDMGKLVRVFTLLSQEEVEQLETEHNAAPHLRLLQQRVAEEVVRMVHGEVEVQKAKTATEMIFGKGTPEMLAGLDEATLLDVFSGVPNIIVPEAELQTDIVTLLSAATQNTIFPSKSEARKMLQANAVSINKLKVNNETALSDLNPLLGKYFVVQKGKKQYYLIKLMP
jgi:tyrosyl-tRNA synthetase